MGKVWVPISQVLPIWWVLLHFPVLWKIDGETHTFPISWSIPYNGNLMEKNHPYYGKSMSTNFPGSPYMTGFLAFSCSVGNWWGNLCIFQMMKCAIGWECNGKKAPVLWEKYEYHFFSLSSYHGFCLHLPVLREIDEKIHAFPIWWHWLTFSCQRSKTYEFIKLSSQNCGNKTNIILKTIYEWLLRTLKKYFG